MIQYLVNYADVSFDAVTLNVAENLNEYDVYCYHITIDKASTVVL